ncbi:MAG: amidohydrolase [Flavobacteriales bacterium]|nr:amidohydrolase [Flavobacteriales bacterium]
MKGLNTSLLMVLLFSASCAHKMDEADLIIHNAQIYTMDDNNTVVEAMAVKDGKILELGAERQIMNKYYADEVVDLMKRPVYPGFIDAHGHILSYGKMLMQADLSGCKSFDEVIDRVKKYADKEHPKVIFGRGWDQTEWENPEFPTREKLDELFPNTPVVLYRIDGHAALVNFKALDLAGVNENSQIDGGEFIVKDGRLTGMLIDNAMSKVLSVLPEFSDEETEKALLLANEHLIRYGITTVDDAGTDLPTTDMMRRLQNEKKFKLRVYAMMVPSKENLDHFAVEGPYKDDRMNIRSFKFMADGALGSWGACLKEPYSDRTGDHHHGALTVDMKFFAECAELMVESGFQMNTHCIGDSAAKLVLAIYAKNLESQHDSRWRIEHAQVMDPNDFYYFSDFSILPSVQPTHAISDMNWAELRIGAARLKGAYAYKSLLKAKGLIALGTDFPVESPDPIMTFYTAVFRKDKNGNPPSGFLPEQALTREEALRGMTIWAAYSNFEENEKGTLEKGKLADFVVLSHDLLKVSEKDILRAYIFSTYINGERVYSYE